MTKWVGLGLFCFVLGLFLFTDKIHLPTSTAPAFGKVLKVEGEVLGKSEVEPFFQSLTNDSNISENYKILTGFDSKAHIEFGETFTLDSNSSVRLEKTSTGLSVHLLSGNLSREKLGDTNFYVDGKAVDSQSLEKAGVTQLTQIPLDEVSITKEETSTAIPEADNKKQIYQTFKLHQRFIEKCFIKHYARLEGQTQSGKVWVAFNVNPQGNLTNPEIDKSDYSDSEFHDCLKEVIKRVQLKGYQGPEMQIKFPINIELPE